MSIQPPERYKARRWPIYVTLLTLVLLLAFWALTTLFVPPSATSVPSLQAVPTVAAVPSTASPTAVHTSPTAPAPVPAQVSITPAAIRQLYIPSTDPTKVIDVPVLAMPSSCLTVIEPPMSGPHVGDVFQCMDFAMPGTNAQSNAVLAGHSSYDLPTVFNKLYPQGESLVGRQVLVRTEASGSQWLDYQIQNVYQPTKDKLPYMEEVWRSTPGRLILITCEQEGNGVSTHNFVVVAQLKGVQSS